MREKWLAVPDWPDYEVSDFGRVRSRKYGKRMLKLVHAKSGHLKVHLRNNERHRNEYVHRLVLFAFVGPCPSGKECRHFPDRSPKNNRLNNLSWDTRLVNQRDSIRHRTRARGEQHGLAKLSNQKIRAIQRIKVWSYGTLVKLARSYGVHVETIRRIRDRKVWAHIES